MLRSMLFPALAGAFCIACANPSYAEGAKVILYGVVDAGMASTRVNDSDGARRSKTGLISGGFSDSMIGLKGSEDLGDGWSALFTLESQFSMADGKLEDEERLFDQAAWLGLGNERYGELRLGRQYTAAQLAGNELEIAPWAEMGMGATFKASDNYQVPNSITYLSPSLAGFSLGASYSFDTTGEQIRGQRSPQASVALSYENGPLLLVATWDKTWLTDTLVPDAPKPMAWQLGASYDLDFAKVMVAWSRQRNGYAGRDGGDPDELGLGLGAREFVYGGRLDSYLLGLAVPVGERATVLLQWSLVKPKWTWQDGEEARSGQLGTLGYTYSLSPRTTLYAAAGFARHYSLENQIVQGQGNTRRYMVGMSHSF
jgi:predicted porin